MKRKIFAVIGLSLLLVACGGNDTKVIEGGTNKGASSQAGDQKGEEETAANQSKSGYVFEYNGVAVSMDEPAEPIVEALGEPASYFEAASCAFEGLDKVYTYNSFELDTYPTDGKDFVSCVVFKDDAITTPEGVGIGDPLSKVTETYGDGTDVGGMLVFEKDNMKLCFIISDDNVVSIEYRSKVLDE